ncbi:MULTISPECIES: transcriptional regulator [Bacillus cereus group]|uniref:Transcriptional regulator n=1 Tax=Bacillus cereus TaxID=1396 RepID=A0A9X7M2A2_BACCE|nr:MULTISPECIES: transcriptional regulator [Bacillus cereus group]MCQ6288125.1 transcriptional regulator [Bacillus cereus]MCQ6316542.1 transcriptional regulator [Bacillus cereus]MCQ6327659.1 transcriptional regulator [Bacillus cereus]MCQ6385137.1 transcriptional regulator [Bacillus cereus]MDF9626841.1 transcriptional regulator [Bacillus cereus]
MTRQRKRTKFGQWLDKNKIEQKEFQKIAKIGRTTCHHLCNDKEHIPSVPVLRAVIKAIKKIDPRAKYTDFFDI